MIKKELKWYFLPPTHRAWKGVWCWRISGFSWQLLWWGRRQNVCERMGMLGWRRNGGSWGIHCLVSPDRHLTTWHLRTVRTTWQTMRRWGGGGRGGRCCPGEKRWAPLTWWKPLCTRHMTDDFWLAFFFFFLFVNHSPYTQQGELGGGCRKSLPQMTTIL